MKKTVFSILAVAGILALASCDTKECRCYEVSGNRVIKVTTSTMAGTPCSDLNTPRTRKCDEMSDPELNPNYMDPSEWKK